MSKQIAAIKQILSVTQHNDDDIEFEVLCCDDVVRTFHDCGFVNIKAGHSFEFEKDDLQIINIDNL